jgi:ATP-binding cassette subfamily C protein
LSTIRDCDEIIVLDQGKVIQRGTHDLLCSVDGPYTRLNGSEEIEAETYESDSWESRC